MQQQRLGVNEILQVFLNLWHDKKVSQLEKNFS